MAGQITHILAGEEALRLAAPDLAEETLDACGAYFRLGCQGPDLFYHNQRTKPSGLHYGSLAHRRNYGRIVEGALDSIAPPHRRPDAPAGAYLLGMATHAAVDRATHPFIVYFSGWQSADRPGSERFRSCHPFFERVLDMAILASLRGQRPAEFDIEALLSPRGDDAGTAGDAASSRAADRELIGLWAAGLRAAYPQSTADDLLLERRIANAFSDGRHFYAITNPAATALNRARADWFAYLDDRAGYRSVALVYPEALPEDLDPMNLAKARWLHPAGDGRSSSASYIELVEEGARIASEAIRLVLAALSRDGPASGLAEAVGLGGLSVTDRAGAAVAPVAADPLPLAKLMEVEYRKRLAWVRHLRELTDAPGSSRILP
jgi:hypothetical protein